MSLSTGQLERSAATPTFTGMLRLLTSSTELPILRPWSMDRSDRRHPVVTFSGEPWAEDVRVFRRRATVEHWGRMHHGESATVCLCDGDPMAELVTLAWFDPPTDTELLWGFVM